MTSRHSPGHRDANEPLILAVLKQYNVEYFLMPEGAGFDILVFLRPMICIEVKNPEQPPSKRKLTDAEADRKETCNRLKIPYFVIETPEQMAAIISAWLDKPKKGRK